MGSSSVLIGQPGIFTEVQQIRGGAAYNTVARARILANSCFLNRGHTKVWAATIIRLKHF